MLLVLPSSPPHVLLLASLLLALRFALGPDTAICLPQLELRLGPAEIPRKRGLMDTIGGASKRAQGLAGNPPVE